MIGLLSGAGLGRFAFEDLGRICKPMAIFIDHQYRRSSQSGRCETLTVFDAFAEHCLDALNQIGFAPWPLSSVPACLHGFQRTQIQIATGDVDEGLCPGIR